MKELLSNTRPLSDDANSVDSTDPAGHLPIGDVVGGRYRVLSEIGAGGMGRVYVVQRIDSVGEHVALKVIHHPAGFERFESEARIISNLKSPHVVRMIEYGRLANQRPYLAMEYLEGQALSARLITGRLSIRRTLEIIREVSLALEEAHAKGIIHRDMKPSNIFLQEVQDREVVKILDFGIAKVVADSAGPTAQGVTRSGQILGTPAFVAPEVCGGDTAQPASDLYGLGMIAYLALVGRHPYQHVNSLEGMLLAHVTRPVILPESIESAPVRALIEGLLRKDPAARLQPATAVIDAVDAALEDEKQREKSDTVPEAAPARGPAPAPTPAPALTGTPVTSVRLDEKVRLPERPRPPNTEAQRGRRAAALVMMGTAALVVLGALGYDFFTQRPTPLVPVASVASTDADASKSPPANLMVAAERPEKAPPAERSAPAPGAERSGSALGAERSGSAPTEHSPAGPSKSPPDPGRRFGAVPAGQDEIAAPAPQSRRGFGVGARLGAHATRAPGNPARCARQGPLGHGRLPRSFRGPPAVHHRPTPRTHPARDLNLCPTAS